MTIIIMHQTITNHDAIGNDIEIMFNLLNKKYNCKCYAENRLNKNVKYINDNEIVELLRDSNNIVIFHHSIYWQLGEDLLKKTKAKIIFRYHNITPASFFEKFNAGYASSCESGREETKRLIDQYPNALWICDSVFNAQDLEGVQKENITICPPFNKISDLGNSIIDEKLMIKLVSSDCLNLLFVGRIAPNKGHLVLLEILRWYCTNFDNAIKLNIIGKFDEGINGYNNLISEYISRYNLSNNVEFIGEINDSVLMTYYLGSDLFVCASEHEGFCVPVVEAQFFKLPVVAIDTSALKETMGQEQIVIENNVKKFAAVLKVLKENKSYREYLRKKGFENYNNRFTFEVIRKQFELILKEKVGL